MIYFFCSRHSPKPQKKHITSRNNDAVVVEVDVGNPYYDYTNIYLYMHAQKQKPIKHGVEAIPRPCQWAFPATRQA